MKMVLDLEAKLKEAEEGIITEMNDHRNGLKEEECDPESILVGLKKILKQIRGK